MMKTYTLYLKHTTTGGQETKTTVKHCYQVGGIWLGPVRYRNGDDEHSPIPEPIDEEIGWELRLIADDWVYDWKEETDEPSD